MQQRIFTTIGAGLVVPYPEEIDDGLVVRKDYRMNGFSRDQAGLPSFVLRPGQWIEKNNAIGLYVRSGRYGGTYAHKDIAFEFCSAIKAVFKLYLIKESPCTKRTR